MKFPKNLIIILTIILLSCSSKENIVEYWNNGQPKIIMQSRYEGPYYKFFYKNGNIEEEGLLIDSIKEKIWIAYYESGELKSKTNYREGKKFGLTENYYKNGKLKYKGSYNEFEEEDGLWTYYDEHGRIHKKGKYVNGARIGEWEEYQSSTELIKEEYYENPDKEREERNYTNGGVYLKERYSNGEIKFEGKTSRNRDKGKTGEWKYYHENGVLKSIGKYKDDQKIGEWTYWYSNGQQMTRGNYYEGNLEEIRVKKSKSKVIEYLPLDNYERKGVKVGRWKYYREYGKLIAEIKYEIGAKEQITKVIKF